ncbi:MAG: hypothetical protein AAB152_04670 [Candidatus Coatesbacteria bacterium]
MTHHKGGIARALALAALLALGTSGHADCILDVYQNPVPPFSGLYTIYPNWVQAPVGAFTIYEGDDTTYAWCSTSSIVGVTIFNYGTATGGATGDLTGAYFAISCGSKTNLGITALTYAGLWTVGVDSFPAWTWSGNFLIAGDPCSNLGFNCLCNTNLFVYADVNPCATDGATVDMGPGFNDDANPGWPGGIYDDCGCNGPWGPVQDTTEKTIRYVMKNVDKDTIAPGDTINYTIYYGRPGTTGLTNVVVMDTPPPYTHLVMGSAVPAPDPGFDPDPGPPMRLRWTIPPPLPVGGGPTGEITFQLTVDWGNGEAFEPGSGDAGAPEGSWLRNTANGSFGATTCATKAVTTAPTATVVRRFLFWKTANNDILFSPSYGQPPDEITYEIFMKNVSSSKTWWNVRAWDTVPPELDVWGTGFGMDDPCAGWTMTPSGCAQAAAGKMIVGTSTRLTWKLDMPPGMTISIRWKAMVRPTDTSGSTALSRVSIMADGMTGIVGGTGPSGQIKVFTHQVPIVLPTMYVSYLALGAGLASYFQCCNDVVPFDTQTYWLCFFPLNMKTNFNLYQQFHSGDAYVTGGGLSPSINSYAGACSGGAGWFAGCGPERAPAFYLPPNYNACPTPVPLHDLFKLVANAPLLWELLSGDSHNGAEVSTYVGTTSLTYNGYTSYTYVRTCDAATNRDGLYFVNTSTTVPTTLHAFNWNTATLSWDYVTTADVDAESLWFFLPPVQNAYRIISSDSTFIIFKALPLSGNPNTATVAPNRENGFLVNSGTPAHFYAFAEKDVARGGTIIVQNLGAAATFDIYKYLSNNPTIPQISTKHQSPNLVGNSGIWSLRRGNDTVAAGTAHAYQMNYDTGAADQRDFYRVDLKAGGPIEVFSGYRLIDSFGGGSVIHSASGTPAGVSYWMPSTEFGHSGKICAAPYFAISFVDFFMPKTGAKVQATDNTGYSAVYTTTGPDQCVTFMSLTEPAPPLVRSLHVTSTGGSVAVAQWQICSLHQKIFTAPFVAQGVHYNIVMPSVVFVGQPFWITVIVVQTAGGTETDYCGTTSFTSTDATAKIESIPMDSFNYVWDSNDAAATCKGAGCTAGCDNGVKLFLNVSMNRLGLQTIVAVDTSDGSVSGVAAVLVVGADIRLHKEPRLAIAASADTVQFKVCWSNYSSASGFALTITDAVPMGTTFIPEAAMGAFNCGSTDGVTLAVAYSTQQSAAMPPPASFTGANPVAGTRWLRWTVPMAGVQTTGCACYRIQIN